MKSRLFGPFWVGGEYQKDDKKTMGFFLSPPLTLLFQIFTFLKVYFLYGTTFADSKEEGT